MTPADFKKLQEKFPIGPGVAKLNCPIETAIDAQLAKSREQVSAYRRQQAADAALVEAALKTPRVSTDEDRLNKLERAYLAYLRAKFGAERIGIQNVTLKLAHDCRLTVDFVYRDNDNHLIFADTKGAHTWEDSLIKLRVAARLFPWARFEIVTRRKDGTWEEHVVKP